MCSRQEHSMVTTLSLLLTLCLWNCGDGNGGGTGPSAVPRVIADGTFSIGTIASAIAKSDPCDFLEFIEFDASTSGTLEAMIDWTFDASNLDMGLFRGRCTCQDLVAAALADSNLNQICSTIAESVSPTAKPERVTALNQPAGNYTMVVLNNSDQTESCSYQVILTPTT